MGHCRTANIQPFLKWAGGKRWLTYRHGALLDVVCERYVEPFLGSGAVFFAQSQRRSLLSDQNAELIETYVTMRDQAALVHRYLVTHHRLHNKDYYYKIRAFRPTSSAAKAARFIYLNRTCWNGLYRVNRAGVFNVPLGTKTQVVFPSESFELISDRLKSAEIAACDFEITINRTGPCDFVFVDPPYTVKHNNNGFLKYNENIFSWSDQVRLCASVIRARNRGAKVLIMNAWHPSILDLYKGVGEQMKLARASVISGSSAARGTFDELAIQCF